MINNIVNVLFCLFVVVIAIWIGIKEQKFSSDYQKRDFVLINKSIKELTEYKRNQKNNFIQAQKESTEIIRWLAQHFKGESNSLAFKPEQDKNGDFLVSMLM
jgi:hypothetical protein